MSSVCDFLKKDRYFLHDQSAYPKLPNGLHYWRRGGDGAAFQLEKS